MWGTPDCGPTSIEFQREQFQNATNSFLGSSTCVFINWGTFINSNSGLRTLLVGDAPEFAKFPP